MKRILILCVCVLGGISLLASLLLAQPASADQITAHYGAYHLELVRWRFTGESSDLEYQLRIPGDISLRGNGCCCTHLPCIIKP